ncbi:MAG: hypothetical protein JXA03_01475 [Bacteroidales bacterium]|nr:hypothetical protein [Bacteroidales bacterium]
MKISVDISYYPVTDRFIPPIVDFIHRMQEREGIEVVRNTMSTQIFGEFATVMTALSEEIKRSFELPNSMFVLKIFNDDTRSL